MTVVQVHQLGGIAGVSVVTPTVGPRRQMLRDAMASVRAQTVLPDVHIVVTDDQREGAAVTRQDGLDMVETEWVAFLDDDDLFGTRHIELCLDAAQRTGADLVYPWFTVQGGTDPFPAFFGKPWNPAQPHHTTVTVLARTDAVRAAGGFMADGPANPTHPDSPGEEYRMVLALNAAGGKIVHLAERTWTWRHHGRNSSGLPERVAW